MRRTVYVLVLILTAVTLVAAAPGRCLTEAGGLHGSAPAEAPAMPPCHEAPAPHESPTPADRPCPMTPGGAVAACCAAPTAPVTVPVSVPAPAMAEAPAVLATLHLCAPAEAPARPASPVPDRPPGASQVLFGCFRI